MPVNRDHPALVELVVWGGIRSSSKRSAVVEQKPDHRRASMPTDPPAPGRGQVRDPAIVS